MPKCWFTLLRFWLRVDQTLVRLRETRFFCNTSLPETEACIIREITHSEGTFAELQAAGAPPEGVRVSIPLAVMHELRQAPKVLLKYVVFIPAASCILAGHFARMHRHQLAAK